MADYGDVSGGYSDQAIRDIVAQLQNQAPAQPVVDPVAATTPAPEVTPTMIQGTGVAPQAAPPGPPMVITPTLPAKAAGDDWTAPVPTMTPPAVTPLPAVMGRIAGVQPQSVPTMGSLMVRPAPSQGTLTDGFVNGAKAAYTHAKWIAVGGNGPEPMPYNGGPDYPSR